MRIWVRDLSIRHKLIMSVVGLILALSVFVVAYFPAQQNAALRAGLNQRGRVLAELLAVSAVAALDYSDEEGAAQIVKSYAVDDALVYARVIRVDGTRLAEYEKKAGFEVPPLPADNARLFESAGAVNFWAPVDGPKGELGTIALGLSLDEIDEANSTNVATALVMAVILLAFGFFSAYLLAGWLAAPIIRMTQLSQRIAAGDLDIPAHSEQKGDELGRMASAFDQMVANLRAIATQALAVAQGDYEARVEIRGEHDTLASAINRMTASLRDVSQQNEKESWFKTGQTELSDKMRGEQDLPTLSRKIISYLCKYLAVQVGALYVKDREERLKLLGSYAYTHRKGLKTDFAVGEALVGQAALEKQEIVLSDVPDDYIRVTSGLGNATPTSILVTPILLEGDVKAVLELASVRALTDAELEFVRLVTENVAIAINSGQDRERMAELLVETQLQSEALRKQQEELQSANDEMAEQTRVLRKSEEELKLQSEELQTANEELEEKTQYLQLQKREIETQNAEIEKRNEEVQAKARDLELASRYKSEFLSNMSHELRTPLNSLLILSQTLADNDDDNLTEDQVEAAKIIHTGGQDLLNLINDILDLSKVEAGKLTLIREDVRLSNVVANLKRQFGPVTENRGLELRLEKLDDAPSIINSDCQRIEQILRNFLSNACKFTKKGFVRLRIGQAPKDVVFRRPDLADKQPLFFAVTDTGVGVPEDKQAAIFEAFRQADGSTARRYGGTGLGLTISRQLSGLLGGEIHVASEKDKGSTFTLYLPLRAPTGEALPAEEAVTQVPGPASTPITSPAGSTPELPRATEATDGQRQTATGERTLLIVEDDSTFAETLTGLAESRGYKCFVAADGAGALQLASELLPNAIILDLGLPDIDGVHVLEQLKFGLQTRHIPVHVISARDHSPTYLQQGAIGFLQKPVQPADVDIIFSRFEKVLQRSVKSLLLVEDNEGDQVALSRLLGSDDVLVTVTGSGEEAVDLLANQNFDCVVLDLNLNDVSGFEVLRRVKASERSDLPPVVVNTNRELTREEHRELSELATTIVVKGVRAAERLLDETSLFLHSVEATLPVHQRKVIQLLHDPDELLKGRRVLLVDDDLRNTFALSGLLKKHGLDTAVAENGQIALDTLEADEGFELVLMDIMMPVMDGFEAIRQIRLKPKLARIPVIALTAKAMTDDRQRCLEAGANDYLTKPVDTRKLLTMMQVWLFQGQ